MTSIHRFVFIVGVSFAAGSFSTPTQAKGKTMQIYRNGALPTSRPPEDTFTGDVNISGYFQRKSPSRLSGAIVTFKPGARTPWKVNPLGQTLVVTSGVGWAQCGGENIVEIRAGDMIWCPPGQRHWEGATPQHEMTYVALHEGAVEFREKVTEEQYRKGPSTASTRR
jgi:quercetin dioxygenase-like cupin family protein